MDDFFNTIREQEAPKNWRAQQCSPIALAFLGDTVFDLYLRTKLVSTSRVSANAMHLKASSYAKAASQARMMRAIEERLTPEEQGIYRRGRNAKSLSVPKNAKLSDYKVATGFEAVLGYLFLEGQDQRLTEIIESAHARIDRKEQKHGEHEPYHTRP